VPAVQATETGGCKECTENSDSVRTKLTCSQRMKKDFGQCK